MQTEEFGGVPDESQYEKEFDTSSGSGLICKTCHSLVPRMGAHPMLHLEWCRVVAHAVRRQTGAV
jgi:hypothetical protein